MKKNTERKTTVRKASVVCLCTVIAAACLFMCGCGGSADKETLYQTSLLQSLMMGNYEGSITVGELRDKGDTGLGTFEGVDGELIMLDGTVYQAVSDGSVVTADDKVKIPFSDVTFYDQDITQTVKDVGDIEDLKTELDKTVDKNGKNDFYVIKINGTFSYMQVRSEYKQKKPYKPLDEVMKTDQKVYEYKNIKGTIAGLYCPDYMDGINTPGWHFHFLSEDTKRGGHILDLKCTKAEAGFDVTKDFSMSIPGTKSFQKQDLASDQSEAITKVEKNK